MKHILTLIAIFLFSIASGSGTALVDSIGVKKNQGKNFIVHRIEAAEGWFSIARMYGVSYSELRLANKDSSDKLIPGHTLLVPADKLKAEDPHHDKNYIQDDELFYIVKEGETMFSIAKKFFTQVDSLKKWNKGDAELKAGQRIKVGYKSRLDGKEADPFLEVVVPKKAAASDTNGQKHFSDPINKTVKTPVLKPDTSKKAPVSQTRTVKTAVPQQKDSTRIIKTASTVKPPEKKIVSASRKQVSETGVASWIRDDDINPNKYYGLHRYASIGTIIKVINKMNGKYVFVKVVGSLPDTGDNKDLIIKISKASAEKLGVRDSRFQCELNFGVTERQ